MSEVNDLLGIKPIGEAIDKTVGAIIDSASVFLNTVCKPAMVEFGFLLSDKVRYWRLNNISKMLMKAKDKMEFTNGKLELRANPKVAIAVMESSSYEEDDTIQDMWAGLFVSSCTEDGKDDSNMVFVDLLKRLNSIEARILQYACSNAYIDVFKNGLIIGEKYLVSFNDIITISGTDDMYVIDNCLDHLEQIGLLRKSVFDGTSGFIATDETLQAGITPSALGLSLYHIVNGSKLSLLDFYRSQLREYKDEDEESL